MTETIHRQERAGRIRVTLGGRTDLARAQRRAQALLDQLGPQWESRIWRNIHWCYAARLGGLEVFEHVDDYWEPATPTSYTAFLNQSGRGGGIWAEHGSTPQEAISNVLRVARAEVAYKQGVIEAAEALL
jgi:hypothetical protein